MGPSKMAAIEISWLHFSNNRSSIQSFFEGFYTQISGFTSFCMVHIGSASLWSSFQPIFIMPRSGAVLVGNMITQTNL